MHTCPQADLYQQAPDKHKSVEPHWLAFLKDHLRSQQHAGEQTSALGKAQPSAQHLPQTSLEFEMLFNQDWSTEFCFYLPGLDDVPTPDESEDEAIADHALQHGSYFSVHPQDSSSADAASIIALLPVWYVSSLLNYTHVCINSVI
jgi:hypothetical protein